MLLKTETRNSLWDLSIQKVTYWCFVLYTVNQQILAAIKFGVSQNKVIWRLLNLASPRGLSMQCSIDVYVGGDKY